MNFALITIVTVVVLLAHEGKGEFSEDEDEDEDVNLQPCQQKSDKSRYDTFVNNHILADIFVRTDEQQWSRYQWKAATSWLKEFVFVDLLKCKDLMSDDFVAKRRLGVSSQPSEPPCGRTVTRVSGINYVWSVKIMNKTLCLVPVTWRGKTCVGELPFSPSSRPMWIKSVKFVALLAGAWWTVATCASAPQKWECMTSSHVKQARHALSQKWPGAITE